MPSLTERLEAKGAAISAGVIADMYKDSFWIERFGDRGSTSAEADGDWHVRYLVTALKIGSPEPFADYARSLRRMLTSRGMCTLHIVDNFVRLERAIARKAAEDGDDAAAASATLRYGIAGLARDGAAGTIDHLISTPHASETDHDDYLFSYLADAIDTERDELFAAHVRFVAAWRERRADPRTMRDDLDRIARRVATDAPREVERTRRILDGARV